MGDAARCIIRRMTDHERHIASVRERLGAARTAAALTGSGISAESGLPTFRGVGGLWRTHRVEELASPTGFARDPVLVWCWYNERRAAHAKVEPNAGHRALAQIEAIVPDFTLVTQNVDSLHQLAGSRNVCELHGNLREAWCDGCRERRMLERGVALENFEHVCGGKFRPAVVWFGETLPPEPWERAAAAVGRAEVLLVVGTSGIVQPAALLASHLAGPKTFVVDINPEATPISDHADVVLRGRASEILPQLVPEATKT